MDEFSKNGIDIKTSKESKKSISFNLMLFI